MRDIIPLASIVNPDRSRKPEDGPSAFSRLNLGFAYANLELIEVDVAESGAIVRADDGPVTFWNVLEAGTAQLDARGARTENVYDWSGAVATQKSPERRPIAPIPYDYYLYIPIS